MKLCAVALLLSATAGVEAAEPGTIRVAVAKSIPLLEAASRGSMEKRKQCFTCHNQGLPIIALTTARDRGFTIDDANLSAQVQFTADFLGRNRANYLTGKGQGGQADTAGYALWALEAAGWRPDDTTAAVAEYLLQWQRDLVHWKAPSRRPPTEQSLFTSTHLAVRGLKTFGTPDQRDRIEERLARVRDWVLKTPAEDTEDLVARLRALHVLGMESGAAARELLAAQREDGGWAQLPGSSSDAYATGSALVALRHAGGVPVHNAAYQRGLDYLLKAQLPDGSWHVRSRSKPIQTYYESGYPHGEDQFISITAAGWATTALALALPPAPRLPDKP